MISSAAGAVLGPALARLCRATGADAAMGGIRQRGAPSLVITNLHGMRTAVFQDLRVTPGSGLGGLSLRDRRPMAAEDYLAAANISHHYDAPVQRENIAGGFAVPVLHGPEVLGVIWGVARRQVPLGERVLTAAEAVATRLSRDLGWLGQIEDRTTQACTALNPKSTDLREIAEELDAIADLSADPEVRRRLTLLAARISRPVDQLPPLSQREREVLALASIGRTVPEIAMALGLMPTTAKSHLSNVMRKLGTCNRAQTVVAAHRLGLDRPPAPKIDRQAPTSRAGR